MTDRVVDVVPETDSIWRGGGMTVRVLEIWPDEGDEYGGDVRVERLTGRRGLLKRPAKGGLIPLKEFADGGRMKPFDPTADNPWTRAIQERYGRA